MSSTRSTGPKSQAGKLISSINAFKHGLTAQKWLGPEQQKYFEQIVKSLTAEYLPHTPTEIIMIERVAITLTKSKRLNDIEDAQYKLAKELVTQKLNGHISPQINTILRLVQGDVAQNQMKLKLQQDASLPALETMNIIHRQQNTLSRQLSKELSELITVIKLRKNLEANSGEPRQIEGSDESEWDYE
jgi:hypothetical protein